MNDTSTLSIQQFAARTDAHADATPALRNALEAARRDGTRRLTFEPGRYHFWPDRAAEHPLFVSNNDSGLRRVAFPLFGLQDFEVDGQGAEFVFHGRIVPFAVVGSQNVRLRSFTIDWHRPFHSEAEVLQVMGTDRHGRTTVDLRLPDQYPYLVAANQLLFTDDTGLRMELSHSLEFDPATRETAFKVYDNYANGDYHYAEEIAPGTVRLTSQFATVPTPGNVLVISHTGRDSPGIFVTDCTDVGVSDVTIHHTGAMGLIAQRTRNIRAERLKVTPSERDGRCSSATADATHFVNCAGLVELIDCHFQGQMDDPTNVHGIYERISQILSPTEIEIELAHEQQAGVHITHRGDDLEFVSNETLMRYHVSAVTAAEPLNAKFCRVTLDAPLPPEAKVGDATASLTWIPDLTIRGCTSLKNRARGFLISTGGRALIEDNYFHVPGPAILIAGDARSWFESGAVRDLTIRGNHFDNCNYGVWGHGVIAFTPEIPPADRPGNYYHSGILIENNTFDAFDMNLLTGHSVDGLRFRDNTIRLSDAYPSPPEPQAICTLTDSRNINIDAVGPS